MTNTARTCATAYVAEGRWAYSATRVNGVDMKIDSVRVQTDLVGPSLLIVDYSYVPNTPHTSTISVVRSTTSGDTIRVITWEYSADGALAPSEYEVKHP